MDVDMTGVIMKEEFVQPAVVSEMTGMSTGALAQLRYTGGGPRFYKPTPKTVLYKRSEVVAWVEASVRDRTSSTPSYA
jgi:hypothetical protein